MQLPKPELYVLYTGDRKTHPEEITLKNKFFDGQDVALDIKIKMLYGTGEEKPWMLWIYRKKKEADTKNC